jgi:acyl-coenzyme A synthetase/AMP-(fatty) acid ligase
MTYNRVDTPQPVPTTDLLADLAPSGSPFIIAGPDSAAVFRLARAIRERLAEGLRPEEPVALFTTDRLLIAAALLAAARGGPVLTLPYALSAAALGEMQRVAGITRVLTDHPQDLPPGLTALVPTPAAAELAPGPADPHRVVARLFTGGSTGRPQIWSKTAGNLFGEAIYLGRRFGLGPVDRLLATVPPYHIYGLLFSVLVPLATGAAVLAETLTYPQTIADALTRHRITVLASVPAHYRLLPVALTRRHHLRLALSSAGRLEDEAAAAFQETSGLAVTEVYGSTETGGIAVREHGRPGNPLTPFETVDWRIGRERLRVRSPYLSPELPRDAEGFFRTADRARPLPQGGAFVLRGRADGIVKVGGRRVDLEAVQQRLRQVPGVRDAAVLALAARRGRENEVVAVVEGSVDPTVVRTILAREVEPYALPRRWRVVERLPVSSAGKTDHQAIQALFETPEPGTRDPGA